MIVKTLIHHTYLVNSRRVLRSGEYSGFSTLEECGEHRVTILCVSFVLLSFVIVVLSSISKSE